MQFCKDFFCSCSWGFVWTQNSLPLSSARDSGSTFGHLSVRGWSHSYLTCGKVLDLLLSKWPRSHSVVRCIVSWWFADLLRHRQGFTAVMLFCLATAACMLSVCRMWFGTVNALCNLHFVLYLSSNLSNSDAMELQCSYHSSVVCVSGCHRRTAHYPVKRGLLFRVLLSGRKQLCEMLWNWRQATLNMFILLKHGTSTVFFIQ